MRWVGIPQDYPSCPAERSSAPAKVSSPPRSPGFDREKKPGRAAVLAFQEEELKLECQRTNAAHRMKNFLCSCTRAVRVDEFGS
ncbi:hypothetical protein Q5P01_021918 [Channa striata]|uniref:Uncharacterized protein n=1 Tax=Channa striata TaxID=64152 RepID=A0AA88LWM9_CHASR|nr:hypothetical protein Q5P01_021918 [Channa striata]